MVALERLRNYDHYPSDVFLGAALGLFCGNLVNYLTNKNNSWRFKTGFNSEGVVFKVTKNF
jgi:membrane-associated phospholipid phosphatase